MKEFTTDVCRVRRVGGQRRKGCEWWSEEVGVAAADQNGYRGEIRIHIKRTGHIDLCLNIQLKLRKEW